MVNRFGGAVNGNKNERNAGRILFPRRQNIQAKRVKVSLIVVGIAIILLLSGCFQPPKSDYNVCMSKCSYGLYGRFNQCHPDCKDLAKPETQEKKND